MGVVMDGVHIFMKELDSAHGASQSPKKKEEQDEQDEEEEGRAQWIWSAVDTEQPVEGSLVVLGWAWTERTCVVAVAEGVAVVCC